MSGRKDRERRREKRLRREEEVQEGERRRRLIQLASAAAFVAIAVVGVLVVINQSETDGGDSSIEQVAEVDDELGGINQRGLVLGDPEAEVTLVEFGDLQCPACKAVAEAEIPRVIESKVRTGVAKLEFRNFVILGPESQHAALAALAAAEQDRGWHFIDLFYRNQGFEQSGYVTDEFLRSVAEAARVPDIARWQHDRRSNRVERQVSAQTAQASRLGLEGTPSFAVEGPGTSGLEPIPAANAGELEDAIQSAG